MGIAMVTWPAEFWEGRCWPLWQRSGPPRSSPTRHIWAAAGCRVGVGLWVPSGGGANVSLILTQPLRPHDGPAVSVAGNPRQALHSPGGQSLEAGPVRSGERRKA